VAPVTNLHKLAANELVLQELKRNICNWQQPFCKYYSKFAETFGICKNINETSNCLCLYATSLHKTLGIVYCL